MLFMLQMYYKNNLCNSNKWSKNGCNSHRLGLLRWRGIFY